ncbi:succinate dehydrogenase, hydrophobic membrane anchor protein [Devosia sediminis]|uniref:Succinate dehydrogenase hydrophobic membrane anchor subunit n=1 Tax=Devosia sediminis TaxID=2798801 RepID=A0A934J0C8_9HYPH|nr:succinate dehydrogenase, hydrophobic membrane anchor protein [Devosia sediminis]MBJ3786445.1 succinate dehydrogenase, hydrophobic membrane anchor protein [Devosia sediminis]
MRETVITKDTIANPRSHYGDARASTRHFLTQRITGAINILFLGLLLFIVVRVAGQDRTDLVAVIGNGWIGLPFAVLIAVVAVHMRNGMRDTLEDYMAGSMYRLTMSLNTFYCLAVAVLGIGAVLKIVFWG